MALALVLAAGCGSGIAGSPTEPNAPPPQELVDPCSVLTEQELASLGMRLDTKRTISELDARGCGWLGDPFGISLTTDPDTVADYQARRDSPVWVSFRDVDVNGRPAVELITRTTGEQCGLQVTVGSGSLGLNVGDTSGLRVPVDECAEALRIMEMIEPKLPAAGG